MGKVVLIHGPEISIVLAKLLQITDMYADDLIGIPIKTFFSLRLLHSLGLCVSAFTHIFSYSFGSFSFLKKEKTFYHFFVVFLLLDFPFSDFTYVE